MLKVISLGWGVQSFTMCAMVALGELPPVDAAIHADTTWEHADTYAFAQQWTPWLEARGVPVVTVSDPKQAARATTVVTDIPAFTLDAENNSEGQLRRQCTSRWKIEPMRRFVSAIIRASQLSPHDLHGRWQLQFANKVRVVANRDYFRLAEQLAGSQLSKSPGAVQQWLGITVDEIERAKDSDVRYIVNHFPLLDQVMSRIDCQLWLEARGLPIPPKSSCIFCPYHNLNAWRVLKQQGGSDWHQAVEVDTAIRRHPTRYPRFVHNARLPLNQAVVIPEDFGATQLTLNLIDLQTTPCDSGACFI